MKFLRYLLLLALIVGCSKDKDDKPSDNTPNEPTPISEAIYGKWVVKSGDLMEFLSTLDDEAKKEIVVCSQEINFYNNGEYVETKYMTRDAKGSSLTKMETNGFWKGGDNKIILSYRYSDKGGEEWLGEELSDTLYIQSLDENSLTIRFKESSMAYIKSPNEFSNLNKELVGSWKLVGDSDNVWSFGSDGTGSIIKEIGMGVNSGSAITWWTEHIVNKNEKGEVIEDYYKLYMHKNEAASGWNQEYPILFVNELFLGLKDYGIRRK